MFDQIKDFFSNMLKDITGKDKKKENKKKTGNKAKERLHIVLVQDRANISTDFLEIMKQEIIDVIKKYVIIDESKIDVRFTSSVNNDGSHSAPTLYANVPILNIRNEMKSQKLSEKEVKKQEELEEKVDEALKKEEQFETMKISLKDEDNVKKDKKNTEEKEKKEEKIKKEKTKKKNNKKENKLTKAIEETAKKQREKNKKESK